MPASSTTRAELVVGCNYNVILMPSNTRAQEAATFCADTPVYHSLNVSLYISQKDAIKQDGSVFVSKDDLSRVRRV